MSKIRDVIVTLKSRSTMEGAGVELKRAFGNEDPSLLLDDFHSDDLNNIIERFNDEKYYYLLMGVYRIDEL